MDMWELIAREEIRGLVAAYNSHGDRGRFEETLALFSPTALMVTPFGEYRGLDEIRGVFTGAQEQTADTPPPAGRPHVRHHTSTHHIDVVDEHYATGRCYFAVLTPIGLDHWGHYVDEYIRADGPWRFASRLVRVDGQSPDSVFPPAVTA